MTVNRRRTTTLGGVHIRRASSGVTEAKIRRETRKQKADSARTNRKKEYLHTYCSLLDNLCRRLRISSRWLA
jgi:hypothetical protein